MKIIDMLNCSRQIIFENNSADWQYSSMGTGFVCRYDNLLYIVTAKHVADSYSADALRVQYHPSSNEFIPYNTVVTIIPIESENLDCMDLIIYVVDKNLVDESQFKEFLPYTLEQVSADYSLPLNSKLIFQGYPHTKNLGTYIDYEKKIIRQNPVILEGKLVGHSTSMENCYELEINDVSVCTTLDGMSGSPVFLMSRDVPSGHLLAGVLIRGTHSSKKAHFISSKILLTALQKITKNIR